MSEPIFGRWFETKDVPVTNDPDAWIVTARKERGGMHGFDPTATVTLIRAHYPGTIIEGGSTTWMRIPPPPWLETTNEGMDRWLAAP